MTILRKALGDSNRTRPAPTKNIQHTQPCPGICSGEGRPDLSKNASLQKGTDQSPQKRFFFLSLESTLPPFTN